MEIEQKKKQELEELVQLLERIRGMHTELVTVLIPAGTNIHQVANQLSAEASTAENINRIAENHQQFALKIEHHPKIKAVRQTGTIIAMEWETGADTSYFSGLRDKLYNYFMDAGIIIRPLGNIIYILPPYCITNDELNYIYSKIEQALEEI